jgi:hypothetical protein
MQPARYKLHLPQNNQAALRDELLPARELCALRLPLLARALVVRARAVVVRLLRPEFAERERAATRLPAERDERVRAEAVRPRLVVRDDFADALRRFRPLRLREAERAAVVRVLLRDLLRVFLRLRPDVRELLGAVERERVPELRRLLLESSRAVVERPRLRLRPADSFCCAVLRLTSLLKRLSESASYRKARLFSSNLRKKSSQEISSKVPSPLNPGKSMRRTPGSPPCSVATTVDGTPPRSSAHRRISS